MRKQISILLVIIAIVFTGLAIVMPHFDYANEVYLLCIPICVLSAIVVKVVKKHVLGYLGMLCLCYAFLISFILTGWFVLALTALLIAVITVLFFGYDHIRSTHVSNG